MSIPMPANPPTHPFFLTSMAAAPAYQASSRFRITQPWQSSRAWVVNRVNSRTGTTDALLQMRIAVEVAQIAGIPAGGQGHGTVKVPCRPNRRRLGVDTPTKNGHRARSSTWSRSCQRNQRPSPAHHPARSLKRLPSGGPALASDQHPSGTRFARSLKTHGK